MGQLGKSVEYHQMGRLESGLWIFKALRWVAHVSID
jgi:hypothetical protein